MSRRRPGPPASSGGEGPRRPRVAPTPYFCYNVLSFSRESEPGTTIIRTVISDLGRVVLWFDNNVFLRKLAGLAGRPFDEVKAVVHGDLELWQRFDEGSVTADSARFAK